MNPLDVFVQSPTCQRTWHLNLEMPWTELICDGLAEHEKATIMVARCSDWIETLTLEAPNLDHLFAMFDRVAPLLPPETAFALRHTIPTEEPRTRIADDVHFPNAPDGIHASLRWDFNSDRITWRIVDPCDPEIFNWSKTAGAARR